MRLGCGGGRLLLTVLVVLSGWVGAGCDGARSFTPITQGMPSSSSLTLYEGLPHPSWESERFRQELAAKQTVSIRGYPFYEQPLAVRPADVEVLRRLSAAPSSFAAFGGPKPCGGYHPDYCLSWKAGEVTYELLICLGCHEMKFFGPKHEALADIERAAFARFEAILGAYRSQRPKKE